MQFVVSGGFGIGAGVCKTKCMVCIIVVFCCRCVPYSLLRVLVGRLDITNSHVT